MDLIFKKFKKKLRLNYFELFKLELIRHFKAKISYKLFSTI